MTGENPVSEKTLTNPKPKSGKRKTVAEQKAALTERVNGLDKTIEKLQEHHDARLKNVAGTVTEGVAYATGDMEAYIDAEFLHDELLDMAKWTEKQVRALRRDHDRIQRLIERVNVAEEKLAGL